MRRVSRHVSYQFNLKVIQTAIFLMFLVLVLRIWNLQIIHGEEYRELSKNNRVRKIVLPAPRGNIYDRNGKLLADTRPSYNLTVFLEDIKDIEKLSKSLAPLVDMESKKISSLLEKATSDKRRLPYLPFALKKDLSLEEIIKVEEVGFDLPGVSIAPVPIRNYLYKDITAHLIGYIGRVNKKQYNDLKDSGYFRWDEIGKIGAEQAFEKYLRGTHGGKQVQINNRNLLDKVLGEKDPLQGMDLYLTIDIDIQKKITEAFEDHRGACVLMNAKTGEILSYVSRPSYDPNWFSTGSRKIGTLFIDEAYPLVDRIISGEYAPGSTFKPVVALAALKEEIINKQTSILCNGVFRFGGMRFKCWKKYGHGEVNLNTSLEQSCNVFYYNIGKEIGWKPIHDTGKNLGFGKLTGIILKGEKRGILPSEGWKRKRIGEPWYKGETINYSIGQGYLLVTPLQLALYTTALANREKLFKPIIEKEILDGDGSVVHKKDPEIMSNINIDIDDLGLVRQGLYSVVSGKRGTGRRVSLKKEFEIEVAGKTGTAQASEKGKKINHSLFICFAPYDDPIVACAVLVEYTDSGAKYASPIARVALKSYFEKYPYVKKEEAEQ
ncbi:MAG: penicillin-binding protein 2 [Candidatus Aureabacteria bacterium]|nr:penicillin-binding protein 2 [Candidatus Auribacterota bacterium]